MFRPVVLVRLKRFVFLLNNRIKKCQKLLVQLNGLTKLKVSDLLLKIMVLMCLLTSAQLTDGEKGPQASDIVAL